MGLARHRTGAIWETRLHKKTGAISSEPSQTIDVQGEGNGKRIYVRSEIKICTKKFESNLKLSRGGGFVPVILMWRAGLEGKKQKRTRWCGAGSGGFLFDEANSNSECGFCGIGRERNNVGGRVGQINELFEKWGERGKVAQKPPRTTAPRYAKLKALIENSASTQRSLIREQKSGHNEKKAAPVWCVITCEEKVR